MTITINAPSGPDLAVTITLKRVGASWVAQSEDYWELFDTDTIPTAFMSSASAKHVFTEISTRNPCAIVKVKE